MRCLMMVRMCLVQGHSKQSGQSGYGRTAFCPGTHCQKIKVDNLDICDHTHIILQGPVIDTAACDSVTGDCQ